MHHLKKTYQKCYGKYKSLDHYAKSSYRQLSHPLSIYFMVEDCKDFHLSLSKTSEIIEKSEAKLWSLTFQ